MRSGSKRSHLIIYKTPSLHHIPFSYQVSSLFHVCHIPFPLSPSVHHPNSIMCKLHHLVPFAPLFFPLVSAWGGVGHEAVAYVAQDFVADATKTYIQDILGTGTSYMAAVATWADTYRYTDAGGWSAPLHFVDANDRYDISFSLYLGESCPTHIIS